MRSHRRSLPGVTPDGGFTIAPNATTHVVEELTIGH